MNNFITLLLVLIGLMSCQNSKKGVDKIEIAKQYYGVVDSLGYSKIKYLLADSISIKEGDYEMIFSQTDYAEFLKWGSVFDPTYKILNVELENEIVKVKILKKDTRILFLHKKPIITNEVLRFVDNKIRSVEITDYVIFDEETFIETRDGLLRWIDENYPELNGFIHDQTQAGAIKYLKAIELYKNRE